MRGEGIGCRRSLTACDTFGFGSYIGDSETFFFGNVFFLDAKNFFSGKILVYQISKKKNREGGGSRSFFGGNFGPPL